MLNTATKLLIATIAVLALGFAIAGNTGILIAAGVLVVLFLMGCSFFAGMLYIAGSAGPRFSPHIVR